MEPCDSSSQDLSLDASAPQLFFVVGDYTTTGSRFAVHLAASPAGQQRGLCVDANVHTGLVGVYGCHGGPNQLFWVDASARWRSADPTLEQQCLRCHGDTLQFVACREPPGPTQLFYFGAQSPSPSRSPQAQLTAKAKSGAITVVEMGGEVETAVKVAMVSAEEKVDRTTGVRGVMLGASADMDAAT